MSELVSTRIKTAAAKLGLPHLAETVSQYVQRADEAKMGYLDLLDLILSEELVIRDDRRFRQGLRTSKLPHHKTLDEYDFSFQPELDPRKVKDLATLSFVEAKANVALLGPPEVGKTHIAVALAVAACRAGYSIYFTSLDDIVRNLTAAEAGGRLTNKLGTYLRPGVLVVDEVGYTARTHRSQPGLPGHLQALRTRFDHPDLEQDLQRMGTGVRRRSPRHRDPRPPPPPLRRDLHQRHQLPAQEPTRRHRTRRRRRLTPHTRLTHHDNLRERQPPLPTQPDEQPSGQDPRTLPTRVNRKSVPGPALLVPAAAHLGEQRVDVPQAGHRLVIDASFRQEAVSQAKRVIEVQGQLIGPHNMLIEPLPLSIRLRRQHGQSFDQQPPPE